MGPHLSLLAFQILATAPPWQPPPLRAQAEIQQSWLQARLERVLPPLMRKHGVSMWLIISREHNEDPVFFSLVSPTTFAARRRTIYVFYDRGPEKGLERVALGGSSQGGLYTLYAGPAAPLGNTRELMGDAQWAALRKIIEDRKPSNIAVNISPIHAFADGLSAGEYRQLESALGPEWSKRIVPAGNLAVEYISVRLPEMEEIYRQMTRVVHWLIARAFSREVIVPGTTTSQDVVWWLRQQTHNLGYGTWFQPTVRVQRSNPAAAATDGDTVIRHGDVLHCDYGLSALGLKTDTQHMGYVLRPGESEPPPGLRAALAAAQRLQDILLARIKPGRTGNGVLAATLADMRREGIRGTVYSHPIGDHGHGAGPLIGLWDLQEGVPGRGDLPLLPSTWFSIELSVHAPVPEWDGVSLFVGMEEDAFLGQDGQIRWVLNRQESFHLVR